MSTEAKISVENMNVAITHFMGKTVYPRKGTPEYKNWKGKWHDYEEFELKYHESWDWLMPVYEKVKLHYYKTYEGNKNQEPLKRRFGNIHIVYAK